MAVPIIFWIHSNPTLLTGVSMVCSAEMTIDLISAIYRITSSEQLN